VGKLNGNKKRIPIHVRLFDKNGKVVHNYQRTVKSRIVSAVQVGLENKDVITGTCRITYNKEKDYWNEFNFVDFSSFNETLSVDTEKDLIKDFI
jgi:hypothetical protein